MVLYNQKTIGKELQTTYILQYNNKKKQRNSGSHKFQTNNFIDICSVVSFSGAPDQLILNCQTLITFLDNLEDAILFAHLGYLHNYIID